MPIANVVLTKAQFQYLQENITDVYHTIQRASVIAQSGLQYVVSLTIAAPEVDLVVPFNQQLTRIDGFDSASNFTTIAAQLNLHAINRGGTATGSVSDRLNEYLDTHDILVSQDYANISAQAGFNINTANIDPTLVITKLSLPAGTNGVAYSQTVTTSGGTGAVQFIALGQLPTSLALNQSSGLISGTPTVSGTYVFSIQAEDSIGAVAKVDYSVAIA